MSRENEGKSIPTTDEIRTLYVMFKSGDGTENQKDVEAFETWLNNIKAGAIQEAAVELDESTQASINNFINRPSPSFSTKDRVADVLWLEEYAKRMKEGNSNEY